MKPEKFYQNGCENVTFAKDQPEYLQLPAVIDEDGVVITRWHLTFGEKLLLLFGRRLYLKIMTFGQPLQPIKLEFGK